MQKQVENYRNRFGFYPEMLVTDKIYGNRNNRAYLKEHGIITTNIASVTLLNGNIGLGVGHDGKILRLWLK
ncbi:MAG TPA: hypothetical protein ENH82_03270 [bacterium]|nr:hypothetical protein [bacterium]